MSESRTFRLNHETTHGILRACHEGNPTPHEDIEKLNLPEALTKKEVSDLGLQIYNYAEMVVPTWDGRANGLKTERRVLKTLGYAALISEDYITADNVASHLRKGFGMKGEIIGLKLKREIKRRIPSSIDNFCKDIEEIDS